MTLLRPATLLAVGVLALGGCVAAADTESPDPPVTPVAADSPPAPVAPVSSGGAGSRLSPAADSLAQRTTFVAADAAVLTAATRGGRWLVDVGRVDVAVKSPARLAALREAAAVRSPVRLRDSLEVHGSWGHARAPVTDFDVWNGRVVAVLAMPAHAESLAVLAHRRASAPRGPDDPYAAAAWRVRAPAVEAPREPCARDSLPAGLAARVEVVRDSLQLAMMADTAGLGPAYREGARSATTMVTGCFGAARVLVLATLRGGGDLLTRERAVLVHDDGAVTPVAVRDHRFGAHALLHALDANGDGLDDVAARGYGRRVGGLVILVLDPTARRLTNLTGGFSYER